MSASVGDRIHMHSNTVDVPDREGTIVAVLGSDDGPPYRVRFDSGEETIVTPGPDATIEPGDVGRKVGLAAEQVGEKAGELAAEAGAAAKDAAEKVTGTAARALSQAADAVARRLDR